jgi:hypothetical protein
LSAEEFENSPNPQSIDGEGLAYLDQAWAAVTLSHPAALIHFLDQVPGRLPLLRPAFEKILWRYPDVRSGANRSVFWRLQRLADPTLLHPAVALAGEQTTIRGTEARLTPDGERFLKTELNFVELNGIDDWVGGVHLDSRVGNVWFHQDRRIVRG